MASIFELSAEAANLKDAMEQDLQGEELDNLIVLKSENEEDFKQKVLSYGKLILILEAEIESLKTEVSRLNGRVKIRESLITRLKDALNFSMDQASQKKIENEFVTVLRRAKPMYLEVTDEQKIPENFLRKKLDFEVGSLEVETLWDLQAKYGDKMQVKEEIGKKALLDWFKKTGEVVSGTVVRDNDFTLRIK